jgi:hypothetical protein
MRRCGLERITPVVARVTPVPCNSPACGQRIPALGGKIRDILLLTICLATIILLSSCGTSNNSSSSSSSGGVSVSSGSGQAAEVGTAFGAHFVAKVTIGGSAASGIAVTFTAPSSGASGTFANGKATEIDTTDANGLATSTTFTANSITGEYAVTATATASGQSASVNFGVANTAAPVLVVNAANGSLQTALVGTTFTLPLSAVVDQNGSPVSGVTVTFTAPSSGASGTFAGGALTDEVATDSNGIATSSAFTANSVAGQYQVTASISGGETAVLILTNTSAAQLNLAVANGSMQSTNVGTAFATPLQVRVAIAGTGIPGVTVVFAAPTSGASGTFKNTGQTTESDVTDSNGFATASTFIANSIVGQYQVTASISGGPSGNLILTNTAVAGVPAAVEAVGGTPQTTVVGSKFTSALMAKVVDGTGAPLGNISVTFAAPSSGATATFTGGTSTETDITNSNGVATSSIPTANSTTGTYTVNATVTGVAAPATFSLTNQSPAPSAVVATGGTPQRTAANTAFAPLTATAVDAAGNPVSGVSVNFAAPSSGPSGTFSNGTIAQTVITDSNGHATVGFTANSTIGAPYNVTATVGTVTPANFALMNTVSGVTAYTFYLSGQELLNDINGINFYSIAGTVLVDPTGKVVGGEEDYNDAAGFTFTNIGITGGTLSFNGVDPNGQGTLVLTTTNTQIGSNGTETFKVQFVNNNHALIVQFDGINGTSSGSLDTQILAAPSGGYAFALSGVDPDYAPAGFAGVFVSGGGNLLNQQWPGTLDVSDGSTAIGVQTGISFNASLSSMDAYGRGVMTGLSIPVTGLSPLNLNIAYYIVGTKAMRFIDIDSTVAAAGSAFSQGTNATGASNAGLGQSVLSIAGNMNPKNTTYFAALGQFTTSNTSLPTSDFAGIIDEDELAQQFVQDAAITGTYQVQSNGYGSLTIAGSVGSIKDLGMYFTDPTLNLNDPNNNSNGFGGALLLDLDATLTGGIGLITPQTDTSPSSFSGNYAVGWQDINQLDGILYAPREFDMLAQGPMVANGALNLTGVISDPFETLTNQGTLSTGDTCQSKPKADNNGTGRYSMLEANLPQNPLNCILNFNTLVYPNFEVIMYQASGTQLFWYQRSLEPLRPAQLFLGPLEQQGSLNGIPTARKRSGALTSRGTSEEAQTDAH